MNGPFKTPVATLAAMAAVSAFLVSGGIWLGNLQTRVDEHTDLLAHTEADRRLDMIEADISALRSEIQATDSLLHSLATEEKQRHMELLQILRRTEWQPFLKEE